VDDRRIGRLIRAARLRKDWRQADLEAASGVDQTTIWLVENGRLDGLTLHVIRSVADAEHAITFGSMLPQRGHEVRRWLADPRGPLAGLWFLSPTNGGRTDGTRSVAQRVRRLIPSSAAGADLVRYDHVS
jgi:transcriptional regulator with XRE-family HTH domain